MKLTENTIAQIEKIASSNDRTIEEKVRGILCALDFNDTPKVLEGGLLDIHAEHLTETYMEGYRQGRSV